jgi:response regulator RpfG family c-di-GMP phosphodiesterase
MTLVKVLCVDDEPQVIQGLSLHLHREYAIVAAHSGAEGLTVLQEKGPFTVVLSDMQMPGMNGAIFLAQARVLAPDTTRMLLTGQADLRSAIDAVNEGHIFRFLTKPCPPDQLRLAFKAAAEQHRLITAERQLLEQTLQGSIKALVDVLSLTNPMLFGRAMRVKKHVSDLAEKLQLAQRWQVEVAAMLSQLGCITLPTETAEKLYFGQTLTEPEKEMVSRLPSVTEQLLGNIPRLEVVQAILMKAPKHFHQSDAVVTDPEKQLIARGAHILRIALDFDTLDAQGNDAQHALDTMRGRSTFYNPDILETFAKAQCSSGSQKGASRELPISAVQEGMILAQDVRLGNGTLLATRGYEITAGFVERARHFRPGYVKGPIRVIVGESNA